jgi:tetratricopeptide (TPR) repeat protein
MNDNSSAFKEFSAATSVDPNYAPGYVGHGDVYQRGQDKEAALQEYRRAIQLDPNYAFAYARIGNLYYRNFDNREASIKEYKRAAEIFLRGGQINSYQEVSSILDELNRYTVYTVERGDYLNKIAQRYGVSIQAIVSANRETYPSLVTNPDDIKVGWRLKIPQ